MTVYKSTTTSTTYPYRAGYKDEEGNDKPDSIQVTARKLAVGDIVLIHDYANSAYRSAAVSGIERFPNPTYSKKWKITVIDGKGKVEVFEAGNGRIWQFERQCSQETRENSEERGRNISFRRDVQRLQRKVDDMMEAIGWFLKNGGKNPKMKDYQHQVQVFRESLNDMYDGVGKDLGIRPKKPTK